MTFTVLVDNTLLRSGRFRGTFATVEAAKAYADEEADRSRSFVVFHVYPGTPRDPDTRKPVLYMVEGTR